VFHLPTTRLSTTNVMIHATFDPKPQRITVLWSVLISRPSDGPTKDRRLSWPGWLVTYNAGFVRRLVGFTCPHTDIAGPLQNTKKNGVTCERPYGLHGFCYYGALVILKTRGPRFIHHGISCRLLHRITIEHSGSPWNFHIHSFTYYT